MGKYRYSLPPSSASLAHIFVTMEAHKASLGVVNYAASQVHLLWLHTYYGCTFEHFPWLTFHGSTHHCYSYYGYT